MARTALAIVELATFGEGINDIAAAAVDQPNGNEVANDGKTLLVITNDDAAPHTVTITGIASSKSYNIVATKALVIAAGKTGMFNFLDPAVFNVAGKINIDYDAGTSLTIAAVRIKQTPV